MLRFSDVWTDRPGRLCELDVRALSNLVFFFFFKQKTAYEMVDQLSAAIDDIGSGKVRALLLHAEGPDFSFGGDIVPWPDMDVRELRAMFERYMSVFNRFERLPIPVIAAVQGLCFGGGLELALRADVIFAG